MGMVYKTITSGSVIAFHSYLNSKSTSTETFSDVETVLCIHVLICAASMFYPLSGFIADVYVGRYKIIIFSLVLLLCGCVSFAVGSILYLFGVIENQNVAVTKGLHKCLVVLLLGFIFTFIGFSGYQSNYIQLGLDQLQDAPSHSLGLFVHSVGWFMAIGLALMQFLISWCTCSYDDVIVHVLVCVPFLFIVALLVAVFIGWRKHNWFHTEPARHNPYRTVLQVINFVRKHKYPVQYTALSSLDGENEEPSRFDFAMEKFGGPFTTEQVEDVKTFIKILVVLLSLGPVFALAVPGGIIYTNFVQHVTTVDKTNTSCNWKWIVMDTGGLKYMVAVLFYPVYIWLLYSALRNRVPKIFTRIWLWTLIQVLSASCMLLIDLSGHLLYHHRNHVGMSCMLTRSVFTDGEEVPTLKLPWVVVVLPTVLQSVSPMMITTTTFEFISAQGPYSMKGLLVGVFFAIMGFFQFVGSLFLLPFYFPHVWSGRDQGGMTTIPVVNCGFGYLLTIFVTGAVGLILFTVTIKLYRYRERK